ncbi:MAG: CTP synthase (glutamine hydrolyzing) [Candidatus Micrarchaeaceae archaeon]
MQTKFVVVLGTLLSGLGKGVVTASMLKMFSFYGYKALPVKFDGYLNYDCGTMNPYRHGEVFVLDDKGEVDMDFGTYERFSGRNLTSDLSITGGKLFGTIIEKERRGDFLGRDIQIIPHLTDEILNRIKAIANSKKPDILVIEVGGTVGDIENSYFIEAMRQLALQEKVVFVAVTYIPKLSVVGEQKTKPTQLAFRDIMHAGIIPAFWVCRSEEPINEQTKEKLSLFTNIEKSRIIDDSTQASIYSMPIYFMKQGFGKALLDALGMGNARLSNEKYKRFASLLKEPRGLEEKIAIVGKYVDLKDSYASVKEALVHSALKEGVRLNIKWIEAEEIEKNGASILEGVDGIIVPGGFGKRGTEGMISAIKYARENSIPFLGLCFGMQLMCIEFARNVCKLEKAGSTELDKGLKNKIIYTMPSQRGLSKKGATMRLGAWKCNIVEKNSIAYKAYKAYAIMERHRHRYEFNNKYKELMSSKGMLFSGINIANNLVEIAEWKSSFGVGTQFHPEFKSRIEKPAPLFLSFVHAAGVYARKTKSNKNLQS